MQEYEKSLLPRRDSSLLETRIPSFSGNPEEEARLQRELHRNAYLFSNGEVSPEEFLRNMQLYVGLSQTIDLEYPILKMKTHPKAHKKVMKAYAKEAATDFLKGRKAAMRANLELQKTQPTGKDVIKGIVQKTVGIQGYVEQSRRAVHRGDTRTESRMAGAVHMGTQFLLPMATNIAYEKRRIEEEANVQKFLDPTKAIRIPNKSLLEGFKPFFVDSLTVTGSAAVGMMSGSVEHGILFATTAKMLANTTINGFIDSFRFLKQRQ